MTDQNQLLREALDGDDAALKAIVHGVQDPDTVSAFKNGYFTLTADELRRVVAALSQPAAARQADGEPLYRCIGCGHLYQGNPPTSCDCTDNPGNVYDRWQATPMGTTPAPEAGAGDVREAVPPILPKPRRFWPGVPVDGSVYSMAQADEIRWACFEAGQRTTPPAPDHTEQSLEMAGDNPSIPLSAIRPIAVEAIREITGCPDFVKDGKTLTDTMEEVALAFTKRVKRN